MDMLKDSMSGGDGDAGRIGETLRRHPVPLALIGIGIGWMAITAAGSWGRPSDDDGEPGAAGKLGEGTGQLRDKAAGMAAAASTTVVPPGPYPTESAGGYAYARRKFGEAMAKGRAVAAEAGSAARETLRRAQEAGSGARQRAADYARRARGHVLDTRHRLGDMLQANPLAVGAIGFSAGALLALMLPRNEIETRLYGETAAQMRARAAARARRVVERTLDAALGAVKSEA
jgi:hypothetical protein